VFSPVNTWAAFSAITRLPPVPPPMPPSLMTPPKTNGKPIVPEVIVSCFEPSSTMPMSPSRPPTEAPELVCEISNVPTAGPRGSNRIRLVLSIEPEPFSASVAPRPIAVVLV
jgi:hypothetical protein